MREKKKILREGEGKSNLRRRKSVKTYDKCKLCMSLFIIRVFSTYYLLYFFFILLFYKKEFYFTPYQMNK